MNYAHVLLDGAAVDQWIRNVQEFLRPLVEKPGALESDDAGWLLLRCDDTLRYESVLKYDSTLHLIDELEAFASEFPGAVPSDVAAVARRLVNDAERRRYLNG